MQRPLDQAHPCFDTAQVIVIPHCDQILWETAGVKTQRLFGLLRSFMHVKPIVLLSGNLWEKNTELKEVQNKAKTSKKKPSY